MSNLCFQQDARGKSPKCCRVNQSNLKLDIIFQKVENLHKACSNHRGDWYFTGDYPTPGGNKVVNQAFINFVEGKSARAYQCITKNNF